MSNLLNKAIKTCVTFPDGETVKILDKGAHWKQARYQHAHIDIEGSINFVGDSYAAKKDILADSYDYCKFGGWLDGAKTVHVERPSEKEVQDIPDELKQLIRAAKRYMCDTEQSEILKYKLSKYL